MSEFGKKGYKAFGHGMVCRGKQYAENTVFEEQGAEDCCEAGVMHYCENPLDVLNYYPLIDDECRVVEIAEVEPLAEVLRKGDKCATKKLRIGAKINIGKFAEVSAEYLRETTKGGDSAKQVGGYYAKQVGGDSAQQVGGYFAQQVGGNSAQQVGGNSAKQEAGRNSILVAGEGSRFKVGLHSVVLHYWRGDDDNIAGFKAVQVDGEKIKADTWYTLKNGEFVEV